MPMYNLLEYRKNYSKISVSLWNYYLNYLIDPTFTNVNRLFVLTFENEEDRTSFSKYYLPKVDIKGFNVLIDGKSFRENPVTNK